MSSGPASTVITTQATDYWQTAFDRLDADLRTALTSVSTARLDVVNAVLRAADDKRRLCIRKQWKYKMPSGRVIVVRDVLEKVAVWINRYKAVGDIAVQYDPISAAPPWAAFSFLLNVAFGDVQAFGQMVVLLETIARVMARCRILEEAYIHCPTPTDLARPLEDAIILLYTDSLRLLAKSVNYFGRSTGGK
jgi:hypothetical protein